MTKKLKVSIPSPYGTVEIEADPAEQRAAWALYVEYATRIATEPIDDEVGMCREAMASLYELFGITRQILREAGPGVGIARNRLGGIAIGALNGWIRPFLQKWHPRLLDWEAKREPASSAFAHERDWPEYSACRADLAELRRSLEIYAKGLAELCGAER